MSIAEEIIAEFNPYQEDISRYAYNKGITYNVESMERFTFLDGSVLLRTPEQGFALEDPHQKWQKETS